MFSTIIVILIALVLFASAGYFIWREQVQRDQPPGRHRTRETHAGNPGRR